MNPTETVRFCNARCKDDYIECIKKNGGKSEGWEAKL